MAAMAGMAPPLLQRMMSGFSSQPRLRDASGYMHFYSSSGKILGGLIHESELTESARLMRDVRRAFGFASPFMVIMFMVLPCWNAVAMLDHPTYRFFSENGSKVGICMMLFSCAAVFVCYATRGLAIFPIPEATEVRQYTADTLKAISVYLPLEVYAMLVLTVVLLAAWRMLPVPCLDLWIDIYHMICWCGRLLRDLFTSTSWGATVISMSLSVLVLYMLSLSLGFFQKKTIIMKGRVATMFLYWGIATIALGAAYVLCANKIRKDVDAAEKEILYECKTGKRTKLLYEAFEGLEAIRRTSNCAGKSSVKLCQGYRENNATRLVRAMESQLRCTGFCWDPRIYVAAEPNATRHELSAPALFSLEDYPMPCDVAAQQYLTNWVGGMSDSLKDLAFVLIIIGVLSCIMWGSGICDTSEQFPDLTTPLAA